MPHLIVRGIPSEALLSISEALISELADLCQCPPDHILLECLPTTAVFGGRIAPSFPFVEVSWFDRGKEVRDQSASCIDKHIRSAGIAELEIAFRTYEKESYYANGDSLA